MKTIGIVIVATNAYFVLGLRFVRRFMHFYKGESKIKFYFFSDTDPKDYLPEDIDIEFVESKHTDWREGTNSKFNNFLSLLGRISGVDYLYYFDADTNIIKDFTEEWFLGDLVAGEHYANRGHMKDRKNFDRNPKSAAYVPENTKLPQTYYYGAFFGGEKHRVIIFCTICKLNQEKDRKIKYEPEVNDESYINAYFHFRPPTYVVPIEKFEFVVSDKGGLGNTRDMKLDTEAMKIVIKGYKDHVFDIQNGKLIW